MEYLKEKNKKRERMWKSKETERGETIYWERKDNLTAVEKW